MIGLLLALWTAGAVWVMLRATGREQKSVASRKAAQRLSRMIEEGPAIPMLVRADGRIEAPDRLAGWIGLEKVPDYLSELAGADGHGLSEDQVEELTRYVRRTQKTAAAVPDGHHRTAGVAASRSQCRVRWPIQPCRPGAQRWSGYSTSARAKPS